MVTLKLLGDKDDDSGRFAWSIWAVDSRGMSLVTEGRDDSEDDAKACMIAALGALVKAMKFVSVNEEINE